MIEEDFAFNEEFGRPSYAPYVEDLVKEYMWVDSVASRLYRYMQDDGFAGLPEDDQKALFDKYMMLANLRDFLWHRAREKGLDSEIRNILQ